MTASSTPSGSVDGVYTARAQSSTTGSMGRNITRVRDRNILVDDPNVPEYDNGPGEGHRHVGGGRLMSRPHPFARTALAAALAVAALLAVTPVAAQAATARPAAPAPFDQAFIDGMVPHHRMAIAMARAAQKAGLKQPKLRAIAAAILATQAAEVAQMQAWRARWYPKAPVLSEAAAGKALGLSAAQMGMAHDASALARSSAVDADFAALMVPHHEGAVTMARLALKRAVHPELRLLARAIIAAQTREIAVLKPLAAASAGHDDMAGMDMG